LRRMCGVLPIVSRMLAARMAVSGGSIRLRYAAAGRADITRVDIDIARTRVKLAG